MQHWDGKGLPKQGSPVEFRGHDGKWRAGTFVGMAYGKLVVGCDETQQVGNLIAEDIRPSGMLVRSAYVADMFAVVDMALDRSKPSFDRHAIHKSLGALYDAGYRLGGVSNDFLTIASYVVTNAEGLKLNPAMLAMAVKALKSVGMKP